MRTGNAAHPPRRGSRPWGTALFAVCSGLFLMAGLGRAQSIYLASEDATKFGWLDQYSLDTNAYAYVGPQACVPTVATNALTYLQNAAPDIFGTSLTGSSYGAWMTADETLISAPYMDTSPTSGTFFRTIPSALSEYVVTDRGFNNVQFSGMFQPGFWTAQDPQPDYIVSGLPTWSFLYQSLVAQSAVMLSIVYANGNGHELLVSGLDWTDSNGDGIMEFGEEATISFVDPLDPADSYPGGQPASGPKITSGHLWYDSSLGGLRMSYDQYQGDLPYDGDDYSYETIRLNNAFVIAVPEPGIDALLLLAGACFFLGKKKRETSIVG